MLPDIFIFLLNLIINLIGVLISATISVLPNSPFSSLQIEKISQTYLSHLAWVIPFQSILSVFSSSLVAVGVFYLYQVILRWIKAIE